MSCLLVGRTERRRHGEYIPRYSVPPRLRMLRRAVFPSQRAMPRPTEAMRAAAPRHYAELMAVPVFLGIRAHR